MDQAGTLKPPPEGQDWLHLTAAQGRQSCPERGVWAEPACGACVLRGGVVRTWALPSPGAGGGGRRSARPHIRGDTASCSLTVTLLLCKKG